MIPTEPLWPKAIADTLMYVNYATNRRLRPDIAPEVYAKAGYPNVPVMEAKYQSELLIARAKASSEWA